nr:hypothetical protein [uncultured Desulfobulbus sp.]
MEQTANLRSTLAADHAELRALMHANSPDTSRIRTLSKKISKERDTLRQKALQHHVTPMGHDWTMGSQYCDYSSSMMDYGDHGYMHDSMMKGEDGFHHMRGSNTQHMNGYTGEHM